MTFDLPLEQINGARLETVRADSVREDRQLDFKEILPGNSDDDKREFLSDVTSFAKAAGGDLIFGIRDRREDGKSTGEIETTH
jgi:predicted HTH transcriptional regulator